MGTRPKWIFLRPFLETFYGHKAFGLKGDPKSVQKDQFWTVKSDKTGQNDRFCRARTLLRRKMAKMAILAFQAIYRLTAPAASTDFGQNQLFATVTNSVLGNDRGDYRPFRKIFTHQFGPYSTIF